MAGQRLGVAVDHGERHAEREHTVERNAKPEPLFLFVGLNNAIVLGFSVQVAVDDRQHVAIT